MLLNHTSIDGAPDYHGGRWHRTRGHLHCRGKLSGMAGLRGGEAAAGRCRQGPPSTQGRCHPRTAQLLPHPELKSPTAVHRGATGGDRGCWPAAPSTIPPGRPTKPGRASREPSMILPFFSPSPGGSPCCDLHQNGCWDVTATLTAGSVCYDSDRRACTQGQGGQKAAAFLPRSHG